MRVFAQTANIHRKGCYLLGKEGCNDTHRTVGGKHVSENLVDLKVIKNAIMLIFSVHAQR